MPHRRPSVTPDPAAQAAQQALQILLARYAPAAVLVNERDEICYYQGDVAPYLTLPRGAPTNNVLAQARKELAPVLRQGLRDAARRGQAQPLASPRITHGRQRPSTRIDVIPVPSQDGTAQHFLIVFQAMDVPSGCRPANGGDTTKIQRIEDELRDTRADLQNAIEHLEATNDELRNVNEEAASANEELAAMNEELEDSREELSTLNDVLSSVNRTLLGKIQELETANHDLQNLMASTDIATLCLDRKLRIKWLTPGVLHTALQLRKEDIGRPITDFPAALTGDDLAQDAKTVLRQLAPLEREVALPNARWYLRRTLPYRIEQDRVDGVILTFTDITERKLAADELEHRVFERTAQLRALTVELSLAEERERRALAQDLHDNLGQLLAAAKIKLGTLTRLEHADEMKRRCVDIADLLDHAHTSIRSLVFQLSPPVLFELGLVPALEWLGEEMYRLYELEVEIHDDRRKKPLDNSVSTILFRAVRELLINVAKHAQVSRAKVNVQRQQDRIMISVLDTGVGLNPNQHSELARLHRPRGFGLLSVRERLSYIGGAMQIKSIAGNGTLVTLSAPLASVGRHPEKTA